MISSSLSVQAQWRAFSFTVVGTTSKVRHTLLLEVPQYIFSRNDSLIFDKSTHKEFNASNKHILQNLFSYIVQIQNAKSINDWADMVSVYSGKELSGQFITF